MVEEIKRLENLNTLWDKGRTYMESKNFISAMKQWIDFYEGRQWKTTKFTEGLVKVTVNFIKMICGNKMAQILQNKIKVNFISNQGASTTDTVTHFVEYVDKELQQAGLDRRAVKDALVFGTGIYHYYMQKGIRTKGSMFGTRLRGEIISMNDFVVANPEETDCQNQEWIIMKKRITIKEAIELADKENKAVDIAYITPDLEEDGEVEMDSKRLITVYTRYFRIDGEVYFERWCKGTVLHNPIPLNPEITYQILKKKEKSTKEYEEDLNKSIDDEVYKIDKAKTPTPDNVKAIEIDSEEKFDLYPIEMLVLEDRYKCIFGLSTAEGMIENQIAVNRYYTIALKTVLDNGTPKFIVREDALEGQEITNEPSQVLVNHSIHDDGIRMLLPQQFANGSTILPQEIIALTRSSSHSSEATTGEISTSSDSGYMINQLIAQASKPTEQLQKAYMRSLERIGRIKLLFLQFYYEEEAFTYEMDAYEMDKEASQGREANKTKSEVYIPDDIRLSIFDIVCEAGKGTEFAETATMEFLNNYVLNGTMDNINPETFDMAIEMMPKGVLGEKYPVIKKMIRDKKNSKISQLEQQLMQLQQEIEMVSQQNAQYQEALKSADEVNKQLQKEFTDKLDIYKQIAIKNTPSNYTTK